MFAGSVDADIYETLGREEYCRKNGDGEGSWGQLCGVGIESDDLVEVGNER